MANTCCDGTGWTGVEGRACPDHYNTMTEWLELNHFDVE